MIVDVVTVIMVSLLALAYSYAVKKKDPPLTTGPTSHQAMPETNYVFPLEASELNASCYAGPGSFQQIGSFGVR